MTTFDIPDMTCGHCVASITRAVQSQDPAARVDADLARHRVQVTTSTDAATVQRLIAEAGFTPTVAADPA